MFVIFFAHFRDAKLPIVQQDICDMFFLRSFIMWLLWSFFCLEAYHMVSQSFLYKEPKTQPKYHRTVSEGKPQKFLPHIFTLNFLIEKRVFENGFVKSPSSCS